MNTVVVSGGPRLVVSGTMAIESGAPPIVTLDNDLRSVELNMVSSTSGILFALNDSRSSPANTWSSHPVTINGNEPSFGLPISLSSVSTSGVGGWRGQISRYQSGVNGNYVAGYSSTDKWFARAVDSTGTPVSPELEVLDATGSQTGRIEGFRSIGTGEVVQFAYRTDLGGQQVDWRVLSESGGTLSVVGSGTVSGGGGSNHKPISAIDTSTDGNGLLLVSGGAVNGQVLKNYSVVASSLSELSSVSLTGFNDNLLEKSTRQIARFGGDKAVVLFWDSFDRWKLRTVTGIDGTLTLVGSNVEPLPGIPSSADPYWIEVDTNIGMLIWTEGGTDIKYQLYDCSGVTPVATGSEITEITAASDVFLGTNGAIAKLSANKVLLVWVQDFSPMTKAKVINV